MLVAGRYGYHRDELYFVAASKHLAWGYVDQPPLSVAFVWLARRLFGDSLYGLRLFPRWRSRRPWCSRASRPASWAAAASPRRSRRSSSPSRRS